MVNIMVIYLIKKREELDCECSEILEWKRHYIKYYSTIALIVISLIYIAPLIIRIIKLKSIGEMLSKFILSNPFQFLLSIFIAFGFFNIYFIFKYTNTLEKTKCDCENKNEAIIRKVINYYSIGIIVIYILTTILTVLIKLK